MKIGFILAFLFVVAASQDAPVSNELESFLRQVEFSTSDLDAQDAIESVMDTYTDLVADYDSDTVRLEQDLIGTIETYYGDSSETASNFIEFVKELRRQQAAFA